MTVPIRNNDGFRPILVETETALPREKRCPRRVMLGWPHLIAIVTVSVLFGVAFTTKIHCSDDHPTLRIPSAETTAVKLNITANTTAIKLNVNNGLPETLPNTGKWPKVAWLMSFPNSGTSFTTKMVRHLSHMSTATNYGEEFLDAQGNSIPIYENSTEGPFWVDPQEGASFDFERPTIFAFTKTHCGGRCEKCGPSQYVENPHSFLMQCLSGKIAHRSSDGEIVKEAIPQYDLELVQRAVHLIRNPFDNVVSRFHLELHGFDSHKLEEFPNSREGFRKFCFYLNTAFEKEEESSRLMDPKVWQLMKDVPCRDDFFRFVQWHNLAFVTTQSMGIPTLVVHYENYETKYNETAQQMMEFLHLPPRGELIDFYMGKEYDYFSPAEQDNVKKAMKIMALSFTWDQISHYFE